MFERGWTPASSHHSTTSSARTIITGASILMEAAPFSSSEHRSTSYLYQPLDHATESIRLMRLQPASSFASDVHCDIYHVSLDTKPEYEALSYAWGDPTVTSPIFLEGYPFQATVNLVSALRHLRYQDRARTLWVDAICINQSNLQERGHQVAFMARIYSRAMCDILWLGDDPDNEAEAAFKIIQNMGRSLDNLPTHGRARTKALRAASTVVKEAPTISLERIFGDRPVWRRAWIVQEILVSHTVHIHCGHFSMLWDVLAQFCSVLVELFEYGTWDESESLEAATSWSLNLLKINYARTEYGDQDNKMSVLELWERFNFSEATDPRDRIFALLGLVKAPPWELNVDYTRPASEIFVTVTRSAIIQTQKLDALCIGHKNLGVREQPNIALPTWVNDFSFASELSCMFRLKHVPYLASGETCVSLRTIVHSAPDASGLVISGVLLDSISKLYPLMASIGLYTWNDFRFIIQSLPRIMFKGQYHTGESIWVAFARTIAGDMSLVRYPERQSVQEVESFSRYLQSFLSWKGQLFSRLQTSFPALTRFLVPDSLQVHKRDGPTLGHQPTYWGYRFSSTLKGFMAMVPDIAEGGDILCVLYGSKYPHGLRKVPGKDDTYTLVGTAYVHGFMDGEAIEWKNQGKLDEQRFNLI